MNQQTHLFTIPFTPLKKQLVFQQVLEFLLHKPNTFFHITSLNPEIIVLAKHDQLFKEILTQSSLKIIDGVGVLVAARMLNIHGGQRYPGVDLMKDILAEAGRRRFRTVLIGGKANLAVSIADCYNRKFNTNTFFGVEVPHNISGTDQSENKQIISALSALKPRIVFVAFGSPTQEKWLYQNRTALRGVLCMGVGGAFDFVGGAVKRAPLFVRQMGLEWLFRLVVQPWRFKRQLRLLEFAKMVFVERFIPHEK